MSLFSQKTLKTRAVVIFCGIFLVSHAANLVIYEYNRDKTVLLIEATDLAARIAGIVNLVGGFPREDRQKILVAAETQFLTLFPKSASMADSACQNNAFSQRIEQYLREAFAHNPAISAATCLRQLDTSWRLTAAEPLRGVDVLVTINFPDSEEVVFHAVLPEGESLLQDAVLIYLLVSGAAALLLAWYLIRKAVVPLEQLATAADEIGVNIDAPPLSETGPLEVAVAAKAFNRMQERLKRLVHGQTEMLAAVSHDLRSAVTRLQLRTELLRDDEERRGMLRLVNDMRLMIQSVVDFIRGVDPAEAPRRVNATALVESLCEDMREEGYPVNYVTDEQSHLITCRPAAVRRALQNIIDNAIKYGHHARVCIAGDERGFSIVVEDEGHGIPEAQLDNVLKPFYRLEKSRNPATGGIGLGLAVAQNILHAHGGVLKLMNRKAGGLRVEIRFGAGVAGHG